MENKDVREWKSMSEDDLNQMVRSYELTREAMLEAYDRLKTGQTHYCKECKDVVIVCSHGAGIDWEELTKRTESRLMDAQKQIDESTNINRTLEELIHNQERQIEELKRKNKGLNEMYGTFLDHSCHKTVSTIYTEELKSKLSSALEMISEMEEALYEYKSYETGVCENPDPAKQTLAKLSAFREKIK